jgi:hypothetical protein
MTSLEERVARVELSVSRWKRAAICLGAALIGVTALGAAPSFIPESLHARRFEVVNEQGKTIAAVGQVQGRGVISLYDESGKLQFVVAAGSDGGIMSLSNGNEQLVTAGAGNNGGKLQISDRSGQHVLTFGPNWTPPRAFNPLRDDPFYMQND